MPMTPLANLTLKKKTKKGREGEQHYKILRSTTNIHNITKMVIRRGITRQKFSKHWPPIIVNKNGHTAAKLKLRVFAVNLIFK